MAAGESYLFLGPEAGEKEDMIAETKMRYLSRVYGGDIPQNPNVEVTSFYPGETPILEISAFLSTGSLFSDARIIYIKNCDTFKKTDAENIAAYMKMPVENTALFLTSDETRADKSLENAAGKNKRVFWELQDRQKPQYVRNYWQKRGWELTDDAVELLLEMIENNTAELRKESERLIGFLSADKGNEKSFTVDGALLEKYLSHTRSESPFTLFSAISEGDLSKSLEILRALLAAKNEPIGIFAGLLWSYRKFNEYSKLREKGIAENETELRKIGITTMKAKKEFPQAYKVYGAGAAERFLALTAEYDMLLRSEGGAMEDVLMDLYLCKLMRRR
jgi:DNA polymerase-3 subunit delta